MSDKLNRFPPVRLAQGALLLCVLQWLLTLVMFLTSPPSTTEGGGAPPFNVRGFLFLLGCVALPLGSFLGLVRRKAYGRWLGLVTLILEWVFIVYAEATRLEWPREGGRLVFVIILHGLLHALFLSAIFHLAFSKRVRELFRSGLFRPRMPDVKERPGMDALFANARARLSNPEALAGDEVEGRRAIAVVTPGREVLLLPCPAPGSMADEHVEPVKRMLPPEPSLNVTAIAYTSIEAFARDEDKTKCIPFLGTLVAFGYIGHSVVIFEGHLSAFESGVRDSDFLMVDSGMAPFLQSDWVSVARKIMRPGAKIVVYDRKTHVGSLVVEAGQAPPSDRPKDENFYAERLLVVLASGRRTSVLLTSGRPLPPLSDFTENPADLKLSAGLEPESLNTDAVIDIIIEAAGVHGGRSGMLKLPLYSQADGKKIGVWTYHVEFQRDAEGRIQILIER